MPSIPRRSLLLLFVVLVTSGCVTHQRQHSIVRFWADWNTLAEPALYFEQLDHKPYRAARVGAYRWSYGVDPGHRHAYAKARMQYDKLIAQRLMEETLKVNGLTMTGGQGLNQNLPEPDVMEIQPPPPELLDPGRTPHTGQIRQYGNFRDPVLPRLKPGPYRGLIGGAPPRPPAQSETFLQKPHLHTPNMDTHNHVAPPATGPAQSVPVPRQEKLPAGPVDLNPGKVDDVPPPSQGSTSGNSSSGAPVAAPRPQPSTQPRRPAPPEQIKGPTAHQRPARIISYPRYRPRWSSFSNAPVSLEAPR